MLQGFTIFVPLACTCHRKPPLGQGVKLHRQACKSGWGGQMCAAFLTVPKGYSNLLGSYNHPLYRPNLVHYVSFKNSHLKEFTNHNHPQPTVPRIRVMTHLSRQPQINVSVPMGIKAANSQKQSRPHYYWNSYSVYSTISISHLQQCWLQLCYPHSNRNCMHEGYENPAWVTFISINTNYSHKLNCKRYHFKFTSFTCSYFHGSSFVPRPEEGGKEGPDVLCLCMCLISVEFHRHLRLFFYICTLEMSKQILNIMRASDLFLSNAARISSSDT